MSVLLITCWRPVTLGSLESCPSMTKLLPRGRVPFTEKFVPVAKVELPLLSWLTPGAESAKANTSRNPPALPMPPGGFVGRSEIRLESKRTPTSGLVVFRSGASSVTVTVSETAAGFSVTLTTATWFSSRTIGPCLYLPNPAFSMVISYGPTGRPGKLKRPSASVVTEWVALVSRFRTATTAPGTVPGVGSLTTPEMVPVVAWPNTPRGMASPSGKLRHTSTNHCTDFL